MTTRRLLSALGASACVAAVIARAVSAALLEMDRVLSDFAVETPKHVPAAWVRANAEWLLDEEGED